MPKALVVVMGTQACFPSPCPGGGAQASSEESEEEGTSDDLRLPTDCHYASRPPRPQAVRTCGGDLGWAWDGRGGGAAPLAHSVGRGGQIL